MYIELKAFQSPGEGSTPRKTKIQLNVGTPFSADARPEIDKEKLDPKKLYELLQHIANDLIPRIVIKHNQDKFDPALMRLRTLRDKHGKSWEEFYENASDTDLAEFREIESDMLDDAIARMGNLDIYMPQVHQFNFEELSPLKLAESVMVIVNNNVPPPRSPKS
jgi:hypothetical protein